MLRPLLAGAGVTGAIAATNRALSNAPLPTNALGGTPKAWNWRGSEIFATEAGSGPPVLLVHSVSTGSSSYEFRRLFPLLARRHRVVAFDLVGCGLSEKPRLGYGTDLFVEQILDALDALHGEPAAVVASGLGAAFAIRAAGRAPARVSRLAAICPSGMTGTYDRGPGGPGTAITALFRSPLIGEAAFNALASRASLRWFLEHRVYGDPARCTPQIVDHYYAVTHQPGARYVPAALAGGALDCNIARDLPFLEVPLQGLWGAKAPSGTSGADADEFLRLARDVRVATFAESGYLPHEEEAEAVDAALASFLIPVAQ